MFLGWGLTTVATLLESMIKKGRKTFSLTWRGERFVIRHLAFIKRKI